MVADVLPGLLAEVQAEFERSYGKSAVVAEAFEALAAKQATYETVNAFAVEVGDILAEALRGSVSSSMLPDGRMYYNIAKRLLGSVLARNHELIAGYAGDVQQLLNDQANIGLKVQVPEFNQDRLDGLVNRLDSEGNFDDVSWLLQEPIVNFSQSIVDDSIRKNVEFHEKVGLKPKIVRTVAGKCCKWCQNLAGSYNYPEVPKDVYRRHQNCRCTVNYKTVDGKIQNVWTKKTVAPTKSDIIEKRKKLNLKKDFDTSRYPHNMDGTLKVTRVVERRLPDDVEPFEVIDISTSKGISSRWLIDEQGRRGMRIDTSDHGQPKWHPMGAHKHFMEYDDKGNFIKESVGKVLTPRDRKDNKDIL